MAGDDVGVETGAAAQVGYVFVSTEVQETDEILLAQLVCPVYGDR